MQFAFSLVAADRSQLLKDVVDAIHTSDWLTRTCGGQHYAILEQVDLSYGVPYDPASVHLC